MEERGYCIVEGTVKWAQDRTGTELGKTVLARPILWLTSILNTGMSDSLVRSIMSGSRTILTSTSSVLELGCGNSQLCEELYKDGVTEITCIDLTAVAVENMQKKLLFKGLKEIKVLEADMLDLPFNNEWFDVVIEKGTMEVLFVDNGDPWNPRPSTVTKVIKMLEGIHRVLKPDGIYISISFGQPHFKRPLFEAQQFTWSVEWNTFGDGFHYFVYALKKGRRRSPDDKQPSDEKLAKPSISLYHDELESEDHLIRTNVDELGC